MPLPSLSVRPAAPACSGSRRPIRALFRGLFPPPRPHVPADPPPRAFRCARLSSARWERCSARPIRRCSAKPAAPVPERPESRNRRPCRTSRHRPSHAPRPGNRACRDETGAAPPRSRGNFRPSRCPRPRPSPSRCRVRRSAASVRRMRPPGSDARAASRSAGRAFRGRRRAETCAPERPPRPLPHPSRQPRRRP